MDIKTISIYIMGVFYIAAGLNHFYNSKMYMRIMPRYIPFHKPVVFISGVIEILLGLLVMIPMFSIQAAWGIIGLLIAIFPANIHHLTSSKKGKGLSRTLLILRLPLQAVFIYWAYWYTAF